MSRYFFEHSTAGIRYVIYARKSTEAEDRQVASIQSQIDVLNEVAKQLNLEVVEVLCEASSAYHQGRKVFGELIERIRKKEFDGILVWKLSRLARNPEEAGILQGMLQRNEIAHIRTVDKNLWPEDNILGMAVEMAQNNQFSRDLSNDTRRGLLQKAERGWCPKTALTLGYIHSPFKKLGDQEIQIDPVRFPIVSKVLRKVAVGELRPSEAYSYAVELGLKTKKDKPISESVFYRILCNPFYYGKFEFPEDSGNWYDGKHEQAITEEEFELIQRYKGRKDAPRPQKHLFPYTGMMKCGECGCSIVVDPKVKVQKNGNTHLYRYYRCTKGKGECSQRYLSLDALEVQLADLLGSIEITDGFHQWAINELIQDGKREVEDRTEITNIAQKNYDAKIAEINKLVQLFLANKVPEDAYTVALAELQKEKDKNKKILDTVDKRVDEWADKARKSLNFAREAKERFEKTEDLKEKNNILFNLGASIVIKDLKLDVEIDAPLKVVRKAGEKFEKVMRSLEPQVHSLSREERQVFLAKNTTMGG